jgi:hypothetical protein
MSIAKGAVLSGKKVDSDYVDNGVSPSKKRNMSLIEGQKLRKSLLDQYGNED